MRRRPTIHERLWPKDSAFDALKAWPQDFSTRVLTRVWQGYDRLAADVLCHIDDWSKLEHVERSLTDLHFDKIQELQTGDEPFTPTREVPNFDARKSAKAMPPANDFGFKLRGGDPSLVWPLEAKVLRRSNDVDGYLRDLNDKYLTCRSSPFTPEAGLIGYLIEGEFAETFEAIASRINQPLTIHKPFIDRPHRTSDHQRTVPGGKPYPMAFRCHHLLMRLKARPSL